MTHILPIPLTWRRLSETQWMCPQPAQRHAEDVSIVVGGVHIAVLPL